MLTPSQRVFILLFLFLGAGLLSACNADGPRQYAYRVRSNVDTTLAWEDRWMGARNENVTVNTDEPFSIWFELGGVPIDQLRLQSRRNDEDWTDLVYSDFPYPEEVSPRVSLLPLPMFGESTVEWPLVIRRFADGAVTNDAGDVFSFRMILDDGTPLPAGKIPKLTVAVPQKHLGGTFVETPGRIGPWQANDGALYFIMEPAETDNVMMMVRSTDGGVTWTEVDGANRPASDDLEGVASAYDGETIHILHQTSDYVWYHAFSTAGTPAWTVTDEQVAAPPEPPTQVAAIAARADGKVVGVYGGPEELRYKIRSTDGVWREEQLVSGSSTVLSGPHVVENTRNAVHLAYTGSDGTAWYRRIEDDGSLTSPVQLATGLGTTEYDVGSVLPLAYIPGTNTVVVIYRLASGELWERRIINNRLGTSPQRISEQTVVQNAVDSDQTGADVIVNGTTVHVLFIEEASGSIYHTYSGLDRTWAAPELLIEDIQGQWIRGLRLMHEGEPGYGFVYDAGSNGGSGMNKYDVLPLGE